MRSELVNYLEIKPQTKILLRACIEWNNRISGAEENDNHQVFLNVAFSNSRLTFGRGLEAVNELIDLQLLEFRLPEAMDLPTLKYLNLWKFIKATMEDIEVNQMGTVPVVDYREICSLIEQKESAGLSSVDK